MAFSVKHGKPRTIEVAVSATLKCESYLVKPFTNGPYSKFDWPRKTLV